MSLEDFAEDVAGVQARQDVANARAERDKARRALVELTERLAVYESIDDLVVRPPKWLAPKKPKDHIMVLNMSGRGDKDLASVAQHLGGKL